MKPFNVHLGAYDVRRSHGLEMIIYHTFGVDNVKAIFTFANWIEKWVV